uniref:Insulin-like growth factor II n=1 Tax=Maruca vitrata TaxID=497515 RepID=A0A385KNT4_MARVT|nr:insulin-like growth factor II [Maruca vitrata]
MVINKAVQLALVAAALLLARAEAAVTVKLCGRQLSEMMSKVCHVYNSPHWETPSVVEQHGAATRRKRDMGISDECCTFGCSLVQLTQYCSISAYSESPLDELEDHMIADRSAESGGAALPGAPGQAGAEGGGAAGRQELIKSAARAAPVLGTVSPLLTWGRTLNTDLPPTHQHYPYVAVYT